MTQTFAELTSEVKDRGGIVEKFIGDAVVAIFGAPEAHVDDPERAVETALGMIDVVKRRSANTHVSVQLRIGINSGLVVSRGVGDGTQPGVIGDAINVAARLQQTAEPGQILVSASVWRRVRERYEAAHVGPLEVKGREETVDAYRIVRRQPTLGRKQAPFVGRRDELALLELLWSNAAKGHTHVVSLLGEPGVGKSRLLAEFPRRQAAMDIRVTCRPEQAFGPLVEVVHTLLGRRPADADDLRSLCRSMPGLDEDMVTLLAALIGVAGPSPTVELADEHQKRQVFAGLWHFLLAATSKRPLLMVLDDVHWADRSSLELIDFLLERLSGAPIMVVLAYRPGFDQVERTAIRASHTGIHLELLSAEESVAMAEGFLGVTSLPADLERLVASRAEGNPFFIEELLQALLELESLAVSDGSAVLRKTDVDIPDTVEGTILARVDRLGATQRAVLYGASVVGRTFSTELLRSITGEKVLDNILKDLTRVQLVVEHGTDQWAFKHALIQEVLYDTLLHEQRRELHTAVAEVLEATQPDSLELLAEHYAKADIRDKARHYAVAAGDAASERMGFVEAAARYDMALRLWGDGEEEERLSVVMKLATAQVVGTDPTAAAPSLIEAEAGWRALGNFIRAGEALATLGRLYFWTGEADRAEDFLQRAIQLLESQPPSPELIKALTWASALKIVTGQVDEGAILASRGLSMDERLLADGPRSSLLTTLGSCQVHLGDPGGVTRIRAALALAERSREAEALGRAYINLVLALSELQESDALEIARRGREVVRKLGALSFEITIAGREAGILTALGRYDEAQNVAAEVLDPRHAAIVAPGILFAGLAMADALLRRGSYKEARKRLDELFPLARRIGGGMFLVPAFAVEAELEEARGNTASARLAIEEGMTVAMKTPSLVHAFHCVVPAARALNTGAGPLLERVRHVKDHPSFEARRLEAEGHLGGGNERFRRAAEVYRRLSLPYERCRCLASGGDYETAAALVSEFGLQNGPLGALLRDPRSQPRHR